MRRLPPLNPLRAFEAVARHRSIAQAAVELNVTHSAVSHQLRVLEKSMRLRLLERDGRKLRLTAQGAALLPSVSSAFSAIAEATVRLTRSTTQGRLFVSCAPALLTFWLIPALPDFLAAFPGVTLKLVPSLAGLGALPEGADVHIHYGDGPGSGFSVRLLSSLRLTPVCSPSLLNSRKLREIADLAEHVLLHADDGDEWHSWLAATRAHRFAAPQQHFLSNAQLAMEAATQGVGLALADRLTISHALAQGRLIAPFELSVVARRAYHIVRRAEAEPTAIVGGFLDWLHATAAATVQDRAA
jgi:LysR family glycine cleavage system transcriptional activator